MEPVEPLIEDSPPLVALSPTDLAPVQSALTTWCARKCQALRLELTDLEEHMLIAVSNGWKLRGLQASIRRTEQRIVYYEKMQAAVAAGYLMVPNFPITVLAVRVERGSPREVVASSEWSRAFDTVPELLPAGEGRYVDERMPHRDESFERKNEKGELTTVRRYVASDYDAPDFPFRAVKPAVLSVTQRAMAQRIFDRIGMVQNAPGTGRDPIMVGQLLDPRGHDRRATFFLAWWLDLASL